jgi:hypothetical protein
MEILYKNEKNTSTVLKNLSQLLAVVKVNSKNEKAAFWPLHKALPSFTYLHRDVSKPIKMRFTYIRTYNSNSTKPPPRPQSKT